MYKKFKLYKESQINMGLEWENEKLNSVLNTINTILQTENDFIDTYKHTPVNKIPYSADKKKRFEQERNVIELGRVLRGCFMKNWRTEHPARYTVVMKIWNRVRRQSMFGLVGHVMLKDVIKIGLIITQPNKDMLFIVKPKSIFSNL